MDANPALGVTLHAIGGLAAASFYIPYKRVKGWSWETYWLAGGFFSWIIAPWALMLVLAPNGMAALSKASGSTFFWTYFFGVLWGIGGLTFGLTMRYLGIALGYAVALGLCALFGTLMPPIFNGEIGGVAASPGGQIVLLGLFVCLIGIAASGLMMKYVAHTDIVALKAFTLGLVYFNWQPLPADPLLLIHLGLVLVLALIFPFSKLLHAPGVFFSPSRNQVDNPREKRHLAPWAAALDADRSSAGSD